MHRRLPSGGELDVFGATRYFDGDLAGFPTAGRPVAPGELRDLKIRCHSQRLGLGASWSKSSVAAAFVGSLQLASPEASFLKMKREEEAAAAKPSSPTPSHRDELSPPKFGSSSSSSSRGSVDLGAVMMGDRRLHGVRVVRAGGGDEERWVVRCGGWEEEHRHEKMVDAASGVDRQLVHGKGDGDEPCWDSDTSSDLFELDLELER